MGPTTRKKEFFMENQPQRASGRSLRGFASMDKEKQKEIASKGGRAAHEKGTAHEFNSTEASMAAKKGHERGTAHEFTPEEARIAGRKGGLARAMNRNRNNASESSSMGSNNGSSNGQGSGSMETSSPQMSGSETSSANHNPS
jgi:general stress protein YciG